MCWATHPHISKTHSRLFLNQNQYLCRTYRHREMAAEATSPAQPAQGSRPITEAFGRCARPDLITDAFKDAYKDVLQTPWPAQDQLPMVYNERYNISFFGIEKLHPFDSCKYRKVVNALVQRNLITRDKLITPNQVTREALADVHSTKYLDEIHTSNLRVVQVTELPALTLLPNAILQWRVVTPMRYHVGGTVLAAALAMQHGWAVNVGGGMHHAYHSAGGGWCPFDDVTMAIRRLRTASSGAVKKVLYVDLDAHQGNGVGRDKLHFMDDQLVILDAYHEGIYPLDFDAESAIDIRVPLKRGCDDATYLDSIEKALAQAHQAHPDIDLVFYNAGTDILQGDPLGRLGVTPQGVISRDQMVWEWAANTAKCPLVMTLSGGYSRASSEVITESLACLLGSTTTQPLLRTASRT